MTATHAPQAETLRLTVENIPFTALAWGPADGPLALCLHGYPDTARTWRHLGPELAARGWRVVAPYTRGYAPTGLAPDGAYGVGALARDALALRSLLADDEPAVLIGHDWGAVTAYLAGSYAPAAFRRIVTMAVAPGPVLVAPLRSPRRFVADAPLILRQLRMSWYMFFQLLPWLSERSLPRLIPKLWADWSPGYDAHDDLIDVLAALREPEHATAALRYYRALFLPWTRRGTYSSEQRHLFGIPPVPLLYLHGAQDGCQLPEIAARSGELLRDPSRAEVIPGVGHFLHLERPDVVGVRIAEFLGRP
jgi:pimeloyl-ACP methyl ester carboxylesterase